MSELAEFRGNASQELTSFIREGLRAFIEFFQTSQFEKMARFYSPDTTLMLPHRGVIRGAGKLPALSAPIQIRVLHCPVVRSFPTCAAGFSSSSGRVETVRLH